jgi:hypothetical protein
MEWTPEKQTAGHVRLGFYSRIVSSNCRRSLHDWFRDNKEVSYSARQLFEIEGTGMEWRDVYTVANTQYILTYYKCFQYIINSVVNHSFTQPLKQWMNQSLDQTINQSTDRSINKTDIYATLSLTISSKSVIFNAQGRLVQWFCTYY